VAAGEFSRIGENCRLWKGPGEEATRWDNPAGRGDRDFTQNCEKGEAMSAARLLSGCGVVTVSTPAAKSIEFN
jgi:hypothetical protein